MTTLDRIRVHETRELRLLAAFFVLLLAVTAVIVAGFLWV